MPARTNDEAQVLNTGLRRYVRVLAGDAPTAAVLAREAVSGTIGGANQGHRCVTAIEMYRSVSRLWRSLGARSGGSLSAIDRAAPEQRRIARMSPSAREAYLLTGMEGFTPRVAATIVDISEAEILSLVDLAKAEAGPQDAARVFIIEDEFLIARDLELIVQGLGHVVVGRARSRGAARELIPSRLPDLILADIQLADDSSGIDAVNDILREVGGVPVIFITAFPARLICAHRPAPTFLVGKPYDPAEVRSAITQVLYFGAKSSVSAPFAEESAGPPLVRFAG